MTINSAINYLKNDHTLIEHQGVNRYKVTFNVGVNHLDEQILTYTKRELIELADAEQNGITPMTADEEKDFDHWMKGELI